MISHLERLAIGGHIQATERRTIPLHHHLFAGCMMFTAVLHIAERTVHFIEVPAEFAWLARIAIFREL